MFSLDLVPSPVLEKNQNFKKPAVCSNLENHISGGAKMRLVWNGKSHQGGYRML